ncbi:hypothetical protein [Bacillus thuringiensis]|nr:hypothetical protein [Bacillus thuringiensis]
MNGQGGGKVIEDYYNIMKKQQALQANSKKNAEKMITIFKRDYK